MRVARAVRLQASAVPHPDRRLLDVLAAVVLGVGTWQAVVWLTGLPAVILPSPLDVLRALAANAGSMWGHVLYTAREVALGWLAGVVAGTLLAVAMAASRWLRLLLYPYLLAVRVLPLVVLAPLLIVLVGPTLSARVLLAAVLTFFPVTVAALEGLLSVPEGQVTLLRSVGTPTWKRVLRLHIPAALPDLFAGLKIATPLAVEGVILAEFLAASRGVGFRLLETASTLETPLLFAYMLALVGLGLTVFGLVVLGERTVRWDPEASPVAAEQLWAGGATDGAGRLSAALVTVSGAGLVAVWQLGATTVPHARLFLPRPGGVAATMVSSPALFLSAAAESLTLLAAGWALGAAVGFGLGALVALVPRTRTPVLTCLVGIRVMPVIAFAPVLLVWFGVSFGAAALLVAASTFFPVAVATATGLRGLPAGYADSLAVVDAPPGQVLLVRLRYATPALFAGVKLSVITGLAGVVIAEWFVADGGLGVLVLQQTRSFQPDLSFAALVWLFAIASGGFGLASLLQRRLSW